MNKLLCYSILGIFSIGLIGCTSSINYKYQNKPKAVGCDGANSDLLHEALYSFEDDIETYYNVRKFTPGTSISIQYGYANYVYLGARGEADFEGIVSKHSRDIYEALKSETDLFIQSKGAVQLDYKHPFVKCLIENIQNDDIKSTMESLILTNSMSSEIMSSPIRINSRDAISDKNFAMYLALDAFYKFLDQEPRTPAKNNGRHDDHNH